MASFTALPSEVQQQVFMLSHTHPSVCKGSIAIFKNEHSITEYLEIADAAILESKKSVKRRLDFQFKIVALRDSLKAPN